MKLVTVSHTGRAEGKSDTADQIRCAMLMAESLNANGEETDSSSFQLPPVAGNEDILVSNIDFDEAIYRTSRPQSLEVVRHNACSPYAIDLTGVELVEFQDKFRSDTETESVEERKHFYAEIESLEENQAREVHLDESSDSSETESEAQSQSSDSTVWRLSLGCGPCKTTFLLRRSQAAEVCCESCTHHHQKDPRTLMKTPRESNIKKLKVNLISALASWSHCLSQIS